MSYAASRRLVLVLGLGILLAIGLYALVRATVVPWTQRMLTLGPKAAAGDAAAAAEAAQIFTRIRMVGRLQLAIGTLIILAMVTARLS